MLAESLYIVQQVREQSKRDQFLMKLQSEFEITCSNLMNQDLFPFLDVCFGELLREEQRLLTQGNFKQDNSAAVAFAAQGKGKGRNMSNIQCYSCKEYGILLTIVERSSAIIANSKAIFSKSVPLVLKIVE
jgi:hypothetical protein